jgi:hypothetical protein
MLNPSVAIRAEGDTHERRPNRRGLRVGIIANTPRLRRPPRPSQNQSPDADALFIRKHKSVLDKLATTDVNNLTLIEAINLLSQIKNEIAPE